MNPQCLELLKKIKIKKIKNNKNNKNNNKYKLLIEYNNNNDESDR